MTEACNLDALESGSCGVKLPPEGHVLSPWVRVTFLGGAEDSPLGAELTVGNHSSPDNNNHAVIKDFEVGHSNGFTARITIIDEQGSSFLKFMGTIMKDARCAKAPLNTN